MAIIEVNRNPSRRELMWFGVIFAAFWGIVGALMLWKFGLRVGAAVVWSAAALVVIAHYAIPGLRRPLYLIWMYAAFPIGWALSNLLLAVVYYLVFAPIGIATRLIGRDPMSRRFDSRAKTYWIPRPESTTDAKRYFRQF